jgi:hypothetical protein
MIWFHALGYRARSGSAPCNTAQDLFPHYGATVQALVLHYVKVYMIRFHAMSHRAGPDSALCITTQDLVIFYIYGPQQQNIVMNYGPEPAPEP